MGPNTILIVAITLIFGVLGARIFKSLKIPQVVGYIIIGIVLGRSGLNLINSTVISEFVPLNFIALGIIGFLVGGELKKEVFKKYGKSLMIILLLEGLGAFIFVTLSMGFLTKNWALAIMLGALASATAPAATVDVLWEYKSAGILTTMVFAIVALDDGLALLLYGFANSISKVIISGQGFSVTAALLKPMYEIIGSMVLGSIVAFIFKGILDLTKKYKHERDLMLSFTFGSILLIIALSNLFKLDLILAEMFFGILFVNIAPYYSKNVFELMKEFSPPIYIIFFVLVGARLKLSSINQSILVGALFYVVARSAGKIIGAYAGATVSKIQTVVRKYLGMCLFSQAGVTIGLAILTAQNFPEIGNIIIGIVTLTTFIVQIIGPPSVKIAITKAGETFRNISEDEMLEKYKVKKVMDTKPTVISVNEPLQSIFNKVAESKYNIYLVCDKNKKLVGIITIDDLKTLINIQSSVALFIAEDIMRPVKHFITPDKKLSEANSILKTYHIDYLPVVKADDNVKLEGLLNVRMIRETIRKETVELQKEVANAGQTLV
ncbi:cation:proton antiporter [bacterium]|nr:cation:proton antiporter [bacterium]